MKLIILFFLSVPSLASSAPESIALKASEIKSLIEERNEKVTSKNLQMKAMEYRKGYLKRSFLPSLKVVGAHERFRLGDNYTRTQPTYGAEISVNLFNGTKDSLLDRIVDKKTQRAGSEKQVAVYQEVIRAKELYWSLAYLENVLNLLSDIKKMNQSNLQSAIRRIKAGIATNSDRYEFEINETEIKRNEEQIKMQKRILQRELLTLVGHDTSKTVQILDSMDHKEDMEIIRNHSEKQHKFLAMPSLLQAEEDEISAKIQSRSWWPKVDAFVARNEYNVRNGNVFNAQEGTETVAGLRVSMNLFELTSGNQEASALKAQAAGAKSEAQYLVKQVENEAHSEIETLDFLHRQIHDTEENILRAQNYFKLTLSEYSRGVKNSPDVLGAVTKFYEAKMKYFEILKDFYITRDHLLIKMELGT